MYGREKREEAKRRGRRAGSSSDDDDEDDDGAAATPANEAEDPFDDPFFKVPPGLSVQPYHDQASPNFISI